MVKLLSEKQKELKITCNIALFEDAPPVASTLVLSPEKYTNIQSYFNCKIYYYFYLSHIHDLKAPDHLFLSFMIFSKIVISFTMPLNVDI